MAEGINWIGPCRFYPDKTIQCTKADLGKHCEHCGWNPDVKARRFKELFPDEKDALRALAESDRMSSKYGKEHLTAEQRKSFYPVSIRKLLFGQERPEDADA